MAKQSREFPVKRTSIMSSMVLNSIATRYLILARAESSPLKFLGASHQKMPIFRVRFREFGCVYVNFRCEYVILMSYYWSMTNSILQRSKELLAEEKNSFLSR